MQERSPADTRLQAIGLELLGDVAPGLFEFGHAGTAPFALRGGQVLHMVDIAGGIRACEFRRSCCRREKNKGEEERGIPRDGGASAVQGDSLVLTGDVDFNLATAIVAGVLGDLLIFDFVIDDLLELRPLNVACEVAAVYVDRWGRTHP